MKDEISPERGGGDVRAFVVDGPMAGQYITVRRTSRCVEVLCGASMGGGVREGRGERIAYHLEHVAVHHGRSFDERADLWWYLTVSHGPLTAAELLARVLRYGCEPAPGWER